MLSDAFAQLKYPLEHFTLEFLKSYFMEVPDDAWLGDYAGPEQIARWRAEGVYLIRSPVPRMFNAIDKNRRHAVVADERYFHYHFMFFKYFSSVWDINELINPHLRAGQFDETMIDGVEAVHSLLDLGLCFIAEMLCNPCFARPDIGYVLPIHVAARNREETQWTTPLQPGVPRNVIEGLRECHNISSLTRSERDLVDLAFLHECGHILLNGSEDARRTGLDAARSAIGFLKESIKLSVHENPETSQTQITELIASIEDALQDEQCLDEIGADLFAMDQLLGRKNVQDLGPQEMVDLMLVQYSLLVASTYWQSLTVQIDAFKRGLGDTFIRRPYEARARTYVALIRIIQLSLVYTPIKGYFVGEDGQEATLREYLIGNFFAITNGSKYIESFIKKTWVNGVLQDVESLVNSKDYCISLPDELRHGDPEMIKLRLSYPVLAELGWKMDRYFHS